MPATIGAARLVPALVVVAYVSGPPFAPGSVNPSDMPVIQSPIALMSGTAVRHRATPPRAGHRGRHDTPLIPGLGEHRAGAGPCGVGVRTQVVPEIRARRIADRVGVGARARLAPPQPQLHGGPLHNATPARERRRK